MVYTDLRLYRNHLILKLNQLESHLKHS
jgi:hypothetical protein